MIFKGQETSDEEEEVKASPLVLSNMELPEGARLSDSDDFDDRNPSDPHRALDINLDE